MRVQPLSFERNKPKQHRLSENGANYSPQESLGQSIVCTAEGSHEGLSMSLSIHSRVENNEFFSVAEAALCDRSQPSNQPNASIEIDEKSQRVPQWSRFSIHRPQRGLFGLIQSVSSKRKLERFHDSVTLSVHENLPQLISK